MPQNVNFLCTGLSANVLSNLAAMMTATTQTATKRSDDDNPAMNTPNSTSMHRIWQVLSFHEGLVKLLVARLFAFSESELCAVVFFHGGRMAAGDRASLLLKWLISPPVFLLPLSLVSLLIAVLFPWTHNRCGFFCRLSSAPSQHGARCAPRRRRSLRVPRSTPKIGTLLIDTTRLAVAGSSAGGMCTSLVAIQSTRALARCYPITVSAGTSL